MNDGDTNQTKSTTASPDSRNGLATIKLSICIATYKRGDVIRETLDCICSQLSPETEVVIVDGNSPDNTAQIVQAYQESHSNICYFKENTNSGVDQDFDKAVGYARGEYCWLMTDDDLLQPEALATVLKEVKAQPELIILDAQVRSSNFSKLLQRSRMFLAQDKHFDEANDDFLVAAGDQLSFIGSVIIRREVWMARDREPYYGSLFVHVGVIMQSPPIQNIRVLAQPLIQIRYGNAMWTPRSFEIWMLMWPRLIWSFPGFSDRAKNAVCPAEPWSSAMALLKHRAKGSHNLETHRKFIQPQSKGWPRIKSWLIACVPAPVANFIAVAYVILLSRQSRMGLSDLLESPNASAASRSLANIFPLSELEQ